MPAVRASRLLRSAQPSLLRELLGGDRDTRLVAGGAAAAAAVVLVGAGVSMTRTKQVDDSPGHVTMLSWNVLARPFTSYNQRFHRANGKVEEPSQTRERYTLAGEEIARRAADLVFLQEFEAGFLSPEWNLAAPKVTAGYEVFRCPQDLESGPGTAVLVKKAGTSVRVLDERPICVGGTSETGGRSKLATVVRVEAGAKRFAAVSAHFTWDGNAPQRLRHAELLGAAIGDSSAVVAGDFNCEPGPHLAALESSSFLGRMRRLELQPGATTGLTGDFSAEVCIDHVYVSADLGPAQASATARPKKPWGGNVTRPAKVAGASDHVPISAVLVLEEQGAAAA